MVASSDSEGRLPQPTHTLVRHLRLPGDCQLSHSQRHSGKPLKSDAAGEDKTHHLSLTKDVVWADDAKGMSRPNLFDRKGWTSDMLRAPAGAPTNVRQSKGLSSKQHTALKETCPSPDGLVGRHVT